MLIVERTMTHSAEGRSESDSFRRKFREAPDRREHGGRWSDGEAVIQITVEPSTTPHGLKEGVKLADFRVDGVVEAPPYRAPNPPSLRGIR